MSTLICSYCSHILQGDAPVPDLCPTCGHNFANYDDLTLTGGSDNSTIVVLREKLRTAVGRYDVVRELGRGGFGSVLLAKDPRLDRLVAIKIPRRGTGIDPNAFERFASEAKNAARLQHSGIVSIYDVEYDGHLPFIVCEYIEGRPLNEQMRRKPYGFREAAHLLSAVASAIDYAHSNDVIHRDIKPSNILIGVDGKPRLTDFGMAKRESISETITADRRILGTPAYMSPEQAWGDPSAIDRRTDVYSLGAVFYQLLTREVPFHGEPRMVMRQVIEEEPRRPRTLNADVPLDLETICLKAMEKERAKRYQTAAELAADLERWLRGEHILARPVPRLERYWRWCRRNPLTASLFASIAIVLTASACGGIIMAVAERRAKNTAQKATKEEHDARTQTEELLREKEAALLENRRLLSKAYVKEASRYLEPDPTSRDRSPNRAFPWLFAALELDESDPQRRDASRIRLAAALASSPRVDKLWRHPGMMQRAAFSPTGDHFFTAGTDGTCMLWDIARDTPSVPALIHPEPVTCATFSPHGKLLVTGCNDGAARIWEVASGKLVAGPLWDAKTTAKMAGADLVKEIAFSRDGHYFVTVRGRSEYGPSGQADPVFARRQEQTVLQVWQTSSMKPVGIPIVSSIKISRVGFPSVPDLLVVAYFDGSISVLDFQTGKTKYRLQEATKVPARADISTDGRTIVGTSGPNSISFWNCESGQKLPLPALARFDRVTNLQFSPDDRFIASSCADGMVCLWNRANGRLVWKQQLTGCPFIDLKFSRDGSELLTSDQISTDSAWRFQIIDVASGGLSAEPIVVPNSRPAVEWNGANLLSATGDGIIRLWHLDSEDPAFLPPHPPGFRSAAVSADCRTAAVIDARTKWCLFRAEGNRDFERANVASATANVRKANSIAISADGRKLALASQKSTVTICESATGKESTSFDCAAPLVHMSFASDGQTLFTVTKDGRLAVWDASTGQRLRFERIGLSTPVHEVECAQRGGLCALAAGREVVLWNTSKGARIGNSLVAASEIDTCRLSDDGRFLLVAYSDRTARVWDCSAGRVLSSTPTLSRSIKAIGFSPKGDTFFTGCLDGSVRVWRTSDARPITGNLLHGSPVTHGAFSPDGRWLLSTSGNIRPTGGEPLVRGWDASTGEPLFVRSLRHLHRRFPIPASPGLDHPWQLLSTFFSADGQRVHAITVAGLLVSIDLTPEVQPSPQLLREVGVRSGTKADAAGGLLCLEPDQLVAMWNSASSSR